MAETDKELAADLRSLSEAYGVGTKARHDLRLAARRLEASSEITEAKVEAIRQRLRERGYTEISYFVIDLVLRHNTALAAREA